MTYPWLLLLWTLAQPAPAAPVYVTASFQDRNGIFLENLSRSEIQILEDGKPRAIEFMAQEQMAAVYGILIERAVVPESHTRDRNPYSAPGLASIQDIAYELIDKYLGRQAIWVGAYERGLEIVLDTTTDGFLAKGAIQRIRGSRQTDDSFLYPALFSAVTKMNERSERRRILIVFLSALDRETADRLKPLKNLLSSSNIELFLISTAPKLSITGGMSPAMSQAGLREIAQVTCGEVFFTADHREHLDDITRRMLHQMRTFYTFGFESQSGVENPAKLSIRCSLAGSRVKHHPVVPVLR
jgi:hypothetical protein